MAVKVAAAHAQAAAAAASTSLTIVDSNNTDTELNQQQQQTNLSQHQVDDNQTIQRSSSHESHLRNKINIINSNLNKQSSNTNLNKANLITSLNSTFNDYCGEHRLLTATNNPAAEISNDNLLNSSNKEKSSNKLYDRRSSIEGSDCSSRGPSGI